ncbi:MAG: hypothetical protein IPG80_03770 [Anaerolineales bacterium]|jgi:hypothetical protein|uniref:hypothetical protein n=1 Tax=Candidatus Villigracilis vicinus TaxID=3140679 RepID=UPI0031374649|nr:hypothetical protein [Anaerolineales bacterium]MBK9781061.1 hypothetical protein [Anaerolineales bacterium]
MKNTISKIMMALLAVALTFAALPATSAFAADENPPVVANEKLEEAWARLLKVYDRTGKAFADPEAHIAKFQSMIDKAADSGKDVSNLQSALDAYETALLAAKPQYDAIGSTINTHAGFDADGKVTDAQQAQATLKEVRTQMKVVKDAMGGSFKALSEAIKAFRDANKPEQSKDD